MVGKKTVNIDIALEKLKPLLPRESVKPYWEGTRRTNVEGGYFICRRGLCAEISDETGQIESMRQVISPPIKFTL